MNIEATAKQIMSAIQSNAFNEEACVKILRDARIDEQPPLCNLSQNDYNNLVRDAMKWRHQLCAAQPKPESWQEIARDAWEEITDLADTLEEVVCDLQGDTRFIRIILTAIERSHAAQPQRGPLVELVEEAYKEGRDDGYDSVAATDGYNEERWQVSDSKRKLDALSKVKESE